MSNSQEDNERIARALRNRQVVCNGLAWEQQQTGRLEESQRMRSEAADCMRLAARYEAQTAPGTPTTRPLDEPQTAPKRPCGEKGTALALFQALGLKGAKERAESRLKTLKAGPSRPYWEKVLKILSEKS